jgi:hypothetical protein
MTAGATGTDPSTLLPPTLETPYNKLPQTLKTEIDETFQHFIKPTRDALSEIKSHLPSQSANQGPGSGQQGEMNILHTLNDNLNKASLNATQLTNTQKRLQVHPLPSISFAPPPHSLMASHSSWHLISAKLLGKTFMSATPMDNGLFSKLRSNTSSLITHLL